ncbi:MAG TPA: flagellar protein FlaG [Nitrosomonas sp.]|nr:flagellar protein FlaG [Nitrosomonas sp.]
MSVDQDTGKTVVKVMDIHTDEVIRQIPTEEAISIARTLDKVQGLLLNDKA